MKPPFRITPEILNLCTEISRVLGKLEGIPLLRPEPKLRKGNRLKTIQASLEIEGNTLQLDQVTAILEGKKVIGPQREILEVQNAIRTYDGIRGFQPHSPKSLREAHRILMAGLLADAGKWRTTNVGVFQGKKVAHAAPQAKRVPSLMEGLFSYIKKDKKTHPLILSAVFHYELEFIHPFTDGNGRIGRFWQTVLLTRFHPLFEYTPVESVVRDRQQHYYDALGRSDKEGEATAFVEFSLSTIFDALSSLQSIARPEPLTAESRLELAREQFGRKSFSRKEYLALNKTISTATASRDIALGVERKVLFKEGEKALARYRFL